MVKMDCLINRLTKEDMVPILRILKKCLCRFWTFKRQSIILSHGLQRYFFYGRDWYVIYMDPPYQGVSNVRDNRYYAGLSFEKFVDSLYYLNEHDMDYIISYDGKYGDKEYGSDLPDDLECAKILLNAGISTQATLLGDKLITYESLYVSRGLQGNFRALPKQLCLAGF